jgi:hypothetical protein
MSNTDKVSPADAIKAKFSQSNIAVSKVDSIVADAQQKEALYSEIGSQRNEQNEKNIEKDTKESSVFKQTSIRISLKDIKRFKTQQVRFLPELNLTYDKVLTFGLEMIEKMNEQEISKYIKKHKTNKL